MTDPRQQFEELVATQPQIQVKGKASRYTSMNGNMFAFVTKEGAIALRLGDDEREAFMKKRKKDLAQYFAKSVAYAKTLAAKPTTRKATAKKAAKK